MPSLYDFAGGQEVLHRLEETFYTRVVKDSLLEPLFGAGQPQHVDHLSAFTAESFGGPDRFTRELGFARLIDVHRHLGITEEQRQRFVELYMVAMDVADLPDDEDIREAVRSHIEFGSKGAMQNSLAETDDELHPCVKSLGGHGRGTTRKANLRPNIGSLSLSATSNTSI